MEEFRKNCDKSSAFFKLELKNFVFRISCIEMEKQFSYHDKSKLKSQFIPLLLFIPFSIWILKYTPCKILFDFKTMDSLGVLRWTVKSNRLDCWEFTRKLILVRNVEQNKLIILFAPLNIFPSTPNWKRYIFM